MSKNNALFGYTGFVGGNLLLKELFNNLYNSKNIKEAKNKEFDYVYLSCVPAVKWLANKNPENDINVINELIDVIRTIKCKKIILISTIDIYPHTDNENNEDDNIDKIENHTYGKNRRYFEKFIESNFENYHIVRLPALFGYGLKKNIIYDLLKNNQINNIPVNSKFQWYNLNWLYDDIKIIIKNEIKICNLFTEPLETKEILKFFEYPKDIYNNEKVIKYNLTSKFSNLFDCDNNKYIRKKSEVINEIIKFINYENISKDNLCISNICVNEISQLQFSSILKVLGFKNVEVAPTKLIDNWNELNKINFDVFIKNNINPYSFQSITYTLNDLNIFSEKRNQLLEHLKNVIDTASKQNIKILVFGCPRNRKIININNNNEEIAINFFREIGDYCKNKSVKICVEPNSKKYNCNFINSIEEAEIFVKKVNNPNIRMMLDLGNAIMENNNLNKIILLKDIVEHIHVSQEYMESFNKPHTNNLIFKKYIRLMRYNKNITLEMLIKEDELNTLIKSLNNFVDIYGTIVNEQLNISTLQFKELYL